MGPPTQRPLRWEAAILSRTRSPMTSRSNWAKESSTLRVSRPMLEVVLKDWVIDTKDTPCSSKSSTSLAKSARERGEDGADRLGLLGHDFELLIDAAIAEGHGSADPEAFALGGRNLVAYPLADDLAF